MTRSIDRLVYMANQIARNFAATGPEATARATADHILAFWDPRMKAQIIARAGEAEPGLSESAAAAIAMIESKAPAAVPAREINSQRRSSLADGASRRGRAHHEDTRGGSIRSQETSGDR